MTLKLFCPVCGRVYDEPPVDWRCLYCGAPLELIKKDFFTKRILGEGKTPLVKTEDAIYKLEYLNPSGSFKDRGVALTLYYFKKRRKCRKIVEDSSGNTGISTALYSSHLGYMTVIHAPKTLSSGKEKLLKMLGSTIVKHESREEAHEAAVKEALEEKACYVGHMTNPLFIEAMKGIVKEIPKKVLMSIEDVIVPVASGTLVLGIYRGLKETGLKRQPRIWGVQTVEHTYLKNKVRTIETENAMPSRTTMADALVVEDPPRKKQITDALEKSGGGVVIVGNKDIKEGLKNLYRKGFLVEPSSSVVIPAYKTLRKKGLIVKNVLLPLTGSGLKYI